MLRTAGNTESDRRSLFLKIAAFFHATNAERSDEMAVFRIERTRDYTRDEQSPFTQPCVIPKGQGTALHDAVSAG